MTLRHAAGSLLVVGLAGAELTPLERAWLKLVRPAGVILFRRNIADAQQARELLHQATELCAPRAFRCVDVEGGTVDRLRDALAPMPSAQAVWRAAQPLQSPILAAEAPQGWGTQVPVHPTLAPGKRRKDGARSTLCREHGVLIARGAKAFGFNVTLAPVLDLGLPASAAVMGTRTAGPAAHDVIAFTREFLAGLASEGVAGCGKHFPGLGGGALDSHLETPSIRRGMRELWREDLEPYRALRQALPMVMVNHAAYPDTPGKNLPATASRYWITTVLRNRLGYRGLIFSDDMEMGGILKFLPIEEAAIASIRAGMDTLEICHSPELILRAYEALVAEAERSTTFRTLLLARAREAERKRARILPAQTPKPLTAKQYEALRTRILRFRDKVQSLAGETEAVPRSKRTLVETA